MIKNTSLMEALGFDDRQYIEEVKDFRLFKKSEKEYIYVYDF